MQSSPFRANVRFARRVTVLGPGIEDAAVFFVHGQQAARMVDCGRATLTSSAAKRGKKRIGAIRLAASKVDDTNKRSRARLSVLGGTRYTFDDAVKDSEGNVDAHLIQLRGILDDRSGLFGGVSHNVNCKCRECREIAELYRLSVLENVTGSPNSQYARIVE